MYKKIYKQILMLRNTDSKFINVAKEKWKYHIMGKFTFVWSDQMNIWSDNNITKQIKITTKVK